MQYKIISGVNKQSKLQMVTLFSSHDIVVLYHGGTLVWRQLNVDVVIDAKAAITPLLTSTEHKGTTHTPTLLCGFDSSVGRALHR